MIQDFNKKLVEAQRELFQYAYQLTKDMDEANDLLQETSYKALKKAELYTKDNSFKGWVVTMMRNIHLNEMKRKTHSPVQRVSEGIFSVSHDACSYEEVISRHDITLVRGMIEELSDGKKEAFSMFLSGFSYQEISDSMGVSIGTTKSRIFNARKELQSRLKVML